MSVSVLAPNRSLQVTFDPPPIFAVAKTVVASNAPELRRCTAKNHTFKPLTPTETAIT